MRESRDMIRKAGGVWGLQAPQYSAREGIWTGKEPLRPRPAKHSDSIAKQIIHGKRIYGSVRLGTRSVFGFLQNSPDKFTDQDDDPDKKKHQQKKNHTDEDEQDLW